MRRHCERLHGGTGRPFCLQCPKLKFFSTQHTLRSHQRYHILERCRNCDKELTAKNLKRHEERCMGVAMDPVNDVADVADAVSRTVQEPLEPVPTLPATGLTRSAHRAPRPELVKSTLEEYWEWLSCPTSIGRDRTMRCPEQHLSKLRTVLGRMAHHHDMEVNDLLKEISDGRKYSKYFTISALDAFTRTLCSSDNGRVLNLQTSYNYINCLVSLLSWMVKIKQRKHLEPSLEALDELRKRVARDKKRDQNPAKKAERISSLPTVPDFIKYLKELEDNLVVNSSTWAEYESYRSFFLVLLLFGTPPQRLQVYENVNVDEIRYRDNLTIMSLADHKTSHTYGTLFVVIPSRYYDHVQRFLSLREKIARPEVKSLFVNNLGYPEKYLTRRFSAQVLDKFGVPVSIRDCRSIYVTYMNQRSTMTEMYELSRRMYHSFQVQQEVYRSTNALDEAIQGSRLSDQITSEFAIIGCGDEQGNLLCGLEYEECQTGFIDDAISDEAISQCYDEVMSRLQVN